MFRRSTLVRLFVSGIFLLPLIVRADVLQVAVASNFAPVLEKLAPVFEQKSGHSVTIISGATGQHYTQIVNGAPFDIFLSADAERPQMLEKEGHAITGSTFTYALGKLVLWSNTPDLVDEMGAVLVNGDFKHLAIASPKLAPYGKAAQETLLHMDVWEGLQDRLVQGENITQTLQFVQTENAELGFIAYSQWLEIDPDNKGSHWEVPADFYSPIIQQGVLLHDSPAARDFIAFLQSAEGIAMIRLAGYELP